MLAQAILSLMLAVGPQPGVSPYSVVETTETARPCADIHKPACRRPWYSAWHRSLVRQETHREGLRRYWVIAQAIASQCGESTSLCKLLLTVTLHESSWRADIHSGKGKLALGDGGRSYSLVQARLGRGSKAGARLVGVHLAATKRAVGWGATHLRRCSRGSDPASTFRCFGGVSNGERDKAIAARVKAYRLFGQEPEPLSDEVRELLGLPSEEKGSAK